MSDVTPYEPPPELGLIRLASLRNVLGSVLGLVASVTIFVLARAFPSGWWSFPGVAAIAFSVCWSARQLVLAWHARRVWREQGRESDRQLDEAADRLLESYADDPELRPHVEQLVAAMRADLDAQRRWWRPWRSRRPPPPDPMVR